jgi:mycofactocin precursor peptide peptidase
MGLPVVSGSPLVLGEQPWTVCDGEPPVLVVPVGSFEQHGPHLPLDTDTRIADHLARALVGQRPGTALGPIVTVSSSGEHAGFPGTLSIGADVTAALVVELVRSADWSGGVVLVNGHGGNAAPVSSACALLRSEGRRVLAWWPSVPGGDAHAGYTETSIMLAIDPGVVGPERPVGTTDPLPELVDRLRAEGVRGVSTSGVLGDATGADATAGRALVAALIADLVTAYDTWQRSP